MKILMVLTSHDQLGDTGRKTGFWLEELAAPYYVFKDAGAQITLASPKGGRPPLDPKSQDPSFQTDITRRFEKDADAEGQLDKTVRLESVKQEDYDTVFYPGGHGPMWDLAEDPNSVKLIESFLAAGKPVALVCHAPGVLRHVKTPAGKPLVDGKNVTGFTNGEERTSADQGCAVPRRGRAAWPRRHLFQGQELGCPHGQGRPPDHWPEPGLVRSGRQGPDRHSKRVRPRPGRARRAEVGLSSLIFQVSCGAVASRSCLGQVASQCRCACPKLYFGPCGRLPLGITRAARRLTAMPQHARLRVG
jgi:putative intracellular protease/amidase